MPKLSEPVIALIILATQCSAVQVMHDVDLGLYPGEVPSEAVARRKQVEDER